ncbi:hypothetical protein [Paenibacillus illinoisensis]|uniref:hypothetical protein n=1 Tax=Paenibacillus illinoisensis TaxID=59845 RepID=UPI003D2856AB
MKKISRCIENVRSIYERDSYGISLTSKDYARFDAYADRVWINESKRTNTGTEYRNNIVSRVIDSSYDPERTASIEYDLDGKYKKLTALVDVNDESKNAKGEYSVNFLAMEK